MCLVGVGSGTVPDVRWGGPGTMTPLGYAVRGVWLQALTLYATGVHFRVYILGGKQVCTDLAPISYIAQLVRTTPPFPTMGRYCNLLKKAW
jgi:hypothetical protein